MSRLEPEPGNRVSVSIVSDPPGAAPRVGDQNCDKATGFLLGVLARSPWRCHFEIKLPAGILHMDWRRVGSTAGYASWKWEGRIVAPLQYVPRGPQPAAGGHYVHGPLRGFL